METNDQICSIHLGTSVFLLPYLQFCTCARTCSCHPVSWNLTEFLEVTSLFLGQDKGEHGQGWVSSVSSASVTFKLLCGRGACRRVTSAFTSAWTEIPPPWQATDCWDSSPFLCQTHEGYRLETGARQMWNERRLYSVSSMWRTRARFDYWLVGSTWVRTVHELVARLQQFFKPWSIILGDRISDSE